MADIVFKAHRTGDTINLTGVLYAGTFPADHLSDWVDWYSGMHRKYGFAKYKQIADALRELLEKEG